MIITAPGIYLPNGQFLPNTGEGHSKNAKLFCERYPELYELLNSQTEYLPDEFMITAGCAIVAGYGGVPCFKIAEDNCNPVLTELKQEYVQEDFSIYDSWSINSEYKSAMDEVIESINITNQNANEEKEEEEEIMNLRGKVGFVVNKKFYSNNGIGHEKNAMELISKFGWDWNGNLSAQDFIVCKKGAIQIGSGTNNNVILVGKDFFTEPQAESIKKQYQLYGYKCFRV